MQNAGAAPPNRRSCPPTSVENPGKSAPASPDQPQATGSHSVCFTPYFLGPAPAKGIPAGRAAPHPCNHLPVGGWGKVAFSKRPRKVPGCSARPAGPGEGQEVAAGKICLRWGPLLTAPAAGHPLPRTGSQAFSLQPRSSGAPPSAALSRSARVTTPRSRSAARGGVGELLGARTLRASASAASAPGAAVPGGGVARYERREEGVTARGGGGSRARLAAGQASALGKSASWALRRRGMGAGRVTPKSQVLLEKSRLRVRSRRVKGPIP